MKSLALNCSCSFIKLTTTLYHKNKNEILKSWNASYYFTDNNSLHFIRYLQYCKSLL